MPSACVLTQYGPPDVLEWKDVPMPEPSEGQIRIKVRVSGVGPTDLKIRRGDLDGVFPLPEPAVLGFETAGVVDAVGSEVSGVAVGDEVAAWLPSLGGYGEYALAAAWTPKPPQVSWSDAGALPASVEAAVGVLRQLGVAEGETLLILGAGGSVGMIATQLAIRQGLKVIGAVGARDEALIRELGATPGPLRRQPARQRPRGRRPSRCDLRRRRQGRAGRRHHAHRRLRPRDHAGGRARGRARRSPVSPDARSGSRRRRDRHAAARLRRTAPAITAVPTDVVGGRSAPAPRGRTGSRKAPPR